MAIRDRGKIKWQFAFGMPKLIKSQRDLWREMERIAKPIIDGYETEQFDQRICYAMEYNLAVKLTVWNDGFTEDVIGQVHYVDPITHQLRIEVKPGKFEWIQFGDVISVIILDS